MSVCFEHCYNVITKYSEYKSFIILISNISIDEKEKNCESLAKTPEKNVDCSPKKDSPNSKKARPSIWLIMKDVCVSLVALIIVTLIAQDLNPKHGSLFVRPLTGSKERSPVTPAAATPSGDGSNTPRYRIVEDIPFFNDENSFVDDYYEGHIYSFFQVSILLWEPSGASKY